MFSLNFKKIFFLVLVSLFASFLLISPFLMASLRGYHPELRLFGDLQLLGYPSFIYSAKCLHAGIFQGIDFLTANGSSSFFLRPNVRSYFLPQLILEFFVNTKNTSSVTTFLAIQLWVDLFLAMFFSSLWFNKICKIHLSYSVVGGVLFAGVIGYVYFQVEFLNVVSMFPALLYCFSILLIKKTNLSQKLLCSLPFLLVLTGGYMPLALMATCVAIITSWVVVKYLLKVPQIFYRDFAISLGLSIFITSGYIFAIFKAVSLVTEMSKLPLMESLYFDSFSLNLRGMITIFLASASPIPGIAEAPHFRLGLPILTLMYIIGARVINSYSIKIKNVVLSCFVIFLFSLLLSAGRFGGLADIFFYVVPLLGGMHIYARYMLIFVFFIAFGLAMGLSEIYESHKPLDLRIPCIFIVLSILAMMFFPSRLTEAGLSLPMLSTEILSTILILFVLQIKNKIKYSLLLVMPIIFFTGSLTFMEQNWINIDAPIATSRDIVNDLNRENNLTNFFYTHSDKMLIKYIDISSEIIKEGGGVPQNFPWFINYTPENTRRISSYLGYESHHSQQKEYTFKIDFYGHHDATYLHDTGVDYIIYDRKSELKDSEWLNSIRDMSVPEYDVGNGFFAIKVLQNITSQFDNGIFRLIADKNSALKVDNFNTNWSTKTEINFNSSAHGSLFFGLFPHHNLKYYLNGQRVQPVYLESGVASFPFLPGKNNFLVSYSNPPLKFFLFCYGVYIILVMWILLKSSIFLIRNCRDKVGLKKN